MAVVSARVKLIQLLVAFSFIFSCQPKETFQKLVQEHLKLLYQTKCNQDMSCVEERAGYHIANKLCHTTKGLYRGHGFNSDKECGTSAYKVLSEFLGKKMFPERMDCQPGEYCVLPPCCSYEEAQDIIANPFPARGCLSDGECQKIK